MSISLTLEKSDMDLIFAQWATGSRFKSTLMRPIGYYIRLRSNKIKCLTYLHPYIGKWNLNGLYMNPNKTDQMWDIYCPSRVVAAIGTVWIELEKVTPWIWIPSKKHQTLYAGIRYEVCLFVVCVNTLGTPNPPKKVNTMGRWNTN